MTRVKINNREQQQMQGVLWVFNLTTNVSDKANPILTWFTSAETKASEGRSIPKNMPTIKSQLNQFFEHKKNNQIHKISVIQPNYRFVEENSRQNKKNKNLPKIKVGMKKHNDTSCLFEYDRLKVYATVAVCRSQFGSYIANIIRYY